MKKQLVLFEAERPKESVAAVWLQLPDEERESVTILLAELMVRSVPVANVAERNVGTERGRDDE